MKKILSLDLGITSIGYSILEEHKNDRYSLVDYGISMFDKPIDEKGNSKKLKHSASASTSNLYDLRKKRKQNLAKLFEDCNLSLKTTLLQQEKQNIYVNKWELRAKKAFEAKLEVSELFSIFYALAKHRGYKSLDSGDLLEELCTDEGLVFIAKKENDKSKAEEKGKIKNALKIIENLRVENPEKTVAQIIYETELQKSTPTFRNHDNYNYMIRREYINDEIKKIIHSQEKLGFFSDGFAVEEFIHRVIKTIDDQKDSTNDKSLFGFCEYYKDIKENVAHQYSLLSDIFKMYESVSNINFNKEKIKISKEQIKLIADDFFTKIQKGKNILDIKYKDVRKILKLDDNMKIFNKDDAKLAITKFHFVNNLSKIDNRFILDALNKENKYEILKDIFDVLEFEKAPHAIYEQLKSKIEDKQTIIDLIREKDGNSMSISHYAMIQFMPYFELGMTTDEIKKKLGLDRKEDYSEFHKGIKYLTLAKNDKLLLEKKVNDKIIYIKISQFEYDDKLEINNHPVKYVVSATMRVIKHLHLVHGAFDEIRVESTRELSLPTKEQVSKAKKEGKKLSKGQKTRESLDKVNRENEAKYKAIMENKEYQKMAEKSGKNLSKYVKKLLMWEEQNKLCPYCQTKKKNIGMTDIFTNLVDVDHIVPKSLGGLYVKHNLVLVHRNCNVSKSNQLPMNYLKDKLEFQKVVDDLYANNNINWKKKKNLLATSLDEIFEDFPEHTKELKATSYIEALTAQMLKRYYPFPSEKKQNDGSAVRHIQGRATSNIRKLLHVKTKVRDTNIHHAIDAILIGLTNQSWLQKLSNTFRENMGVIDDEARAKIKKEMPIFELIVNDEVLYLEPKELIEKIEDSYHEFGDESVFYRDVWGKTKAVNFWVSKKPMVSKIHKDTIYAKKPNNIYTARESLLNNFILLKTTTNTTATQFMEVFEKKILYKMYLYKTNQKDVICQIVRKRGEEIADLLYSFSDLDKKDKEKVSDAKAKLDLLVHRDLVDNNGNVIRKVKFYQTNLTGFEIRGGLATKEKTFIGFKSWLEGDKLHYERIDVANFDRIKKESDRSFKVFKNDVVFFVYPDGSFRGGKIVSFLGDKKMGAFSNPRFPASIGFQPHSFLTIFNGKANSHKQQSLGKAIGIIKLNLDITGKIKSYTCIGYTESELLNFIKESING